MHAITGNGNYANLLKSILEKFVKANQVNLFLAGFSHLKPVWAGVVVSSAIVQLCFCKSLCTVSDLSIINFMTEKIQIIVTIMCRNDKLSSMMS